MSPFFAAQRMIALALALAMVGWTFRSVAASCRVEVVGTDALAWQEAARSLSNLGLTDGDCARIELYVTRDAADLTFITVDGRRAERKLQSPDELAPTIEALRVTGPHTKESRPETQPKEAEASEPIEAEASAVILEEPGQLRKPASERGEKARRAAASQAERATTDGTTSGRSASDIGTVFALQGGARAGADLEAEALLSPAIDGSASIVLRRWEVGVAAGWESHYYNLERDVLSAKESGTVSLGVSVGRREPLAELGLLAGGRLSVAVLDRYETSGSGPVDAIAPDAGRSAPVEWRVGPYVGVVLPRRAAVRFRADLRADIVAQSLVDGTPVTPWWGVAGLLGVEASAP